MKIQVTIEFALEDPDLIFAQNALEAQRKVRIAFDDLLAQDAVLDPHFEDEHYFPHGIEAHVVKVDVMEFEDAERL